MFRTVSLAALAALSLSTTAFAQAGGLLNSEFNHQANDGTYELIGGLMYGTGTAKPSGAGAKDVDLTTQAFRIRADYGFSESMSAGVQLMYTDMDFDAGTGAVGLNDPELFFNYRMAMGAGTLRAGTSLFVAIADAEVGDGGSGGWNQASGGMTLTPYVGYEMALYDGNITGARVTYDLYQSDRSIKAEGATNFKDTSAGQQFGIDLYYETKMSDMWTLGAALNWTQATPYENQTFKDDDTAPAVAGLPGGFNATGVTVYAPIYMQSGKVTILPSINHQMWDYFSNAAGWKDVTNTTIQVAGRFVF